MAAVPLTLIVGEEYEDIRSFPWSGADERRQTPEEDAETHLKRQKTSSQFSRGVNSAGCTSLVEREIKIVKRASE